MPALITETKDFIIVWKILLEEIRLFIVILQNVSKR